MPQLLRHWAVANPDKGDACLLFGRLLHDFEEGHGVLLAVKPRGTSDKRRRIRQPKHRTQPVFPLRRFLHTVIDDAEFSGEIDSGPKRTIPFPFGNSQGRGGCHPAQGALDSAVKLPFACGKRRVLKAVGMRGIKDRPDPADHRGQPPQRAGLGAVAVQDVGGKGADRPDNSRERLRIPHRRQLPAKGGQREKLDCPGEPGKRIKKAGIRTVGSVDQSKGKARGVQALQQVQKMPSHSSASRLGDHQHFNFPRITHCGSPPLVSKSAAGS